MVKNGNIVNRSAEEILNKHNSEGLLSTAEVIAAMEEYAEQFKQPTAQGWECPRCHKIHSWLHMECDCPPKVMTATTNLQPEITDEDIEEWANNTDFGYSYDSLLRKEGAIEGAKAMRDGKIGKK